MMRSDDFTERVITPAMPCCMAYTCCTLNFIIPGSGTMLSGLSVFCCSKNDDMDMCDKVTTSLVSLTIGLLQLALTIFLIGWFWSVSWGMKYINMSKKHYSDTENQLSVDANDVTPADDSNSSSENLSEDISMPTISVEILEMSVNMTHFAVGPPPYSAIPQSDCFSPPKYESLYPHR